MNLETPLERWFALYVKPRHEKVVARLLNGEGLQTFLALYKRRHVYTNQARENDLPLFPGYVFCRFDVLKKTPVLATTGVLSIIGIGKQPAPIDDIEIHSLQTAMKSGLLIEACDFVPTGRKVRINKGSLTGVEGIVVGVRNSIRLILSIRLLQRSVQVEIDASWVTVCDAEPRLPWLAKENREMYCLGGGR
jgi:transcription antitermination factor NusG